MDIGDAVVDAAVYDAGVDIRHCFRIPSYCGDIPSYLERNADD